MNFLRVDSSIRCDGSVSRELTAELTGGGDVVHRDSAAMPALAEAWQRVAASGADELVTTLADEVKAADAIVVGAPLYNFGVPAALKSWLDLLVVDPRFNPRDTPIGTPLAGVRVTLVVVSGWSYGPGSPAEGWNHAIPYLRRIFADAFGAEVTCHAVEGTTQKAA